MRSSADDRRVCLLLASGLPAGAGAASQDNSTDRRYS
jgi:hypothetical protein